MISRTRVCANSGPREDRHPFLVEGGDPVRPLELVDSIPLPVELPRAIRVNPSGDHYSIPRRRRY
jgi:hypothetical protein